MKPTTVITEAEVINSDGTLSLMIDGQDILYLKRVDSSLNDNEHQQIVDTIVKALGLAHDSGSNSNK